MIGIPFFPLPRLTGRRALAALAAVAICCPARGDETLFTALEATPEAVGLALARGMATVTGPPGYVQPHLQPDPFALTAFPSAPAEREALLAALAIKHEFSNLPRQREFAAMLQEGWGLVDEALALLEDEPSGIDPLHFTRLRYLSGDRDGAAEAFAKAREGLDEWKTTYLALPAKTMLLARPFEAQGQPEELAGFLAWLQPQCDSADLACEILHLRLNTAYYRGALDDLLAQLADEPPPLHDLARWSLTGDPAVLPARMETLPPSYLPHFHRVAPTSPTMNRLMETAIREGWGHADDQTALLRYLLEFRDKPEPLLQLWLEQDARALAVLDAALPRLWEWVGRTRLRPEGGGGMAALANRHPDHAAANLLVGRILASPAFPGAIVPATRADSVPHLLRLLGQELLANAADHGFGTASLLHTNRPDFVGMALEMLAETLPPDELLERLTRHPDFGQLPAPDRARYLALGKLDVPFTEALLALDWRDAAHDRFGGWPAAYLTPIRQLRQPAGDLFARLRAALPAILAGSAAKSAAMVVQQAEATRNLFPDAAAFKTLLAELSALLEDDAKNRIDDLAGTLKPRTQPAPQPLPPTEPAEALAYFSPPQQVRWLDHGATPYALRSAASYPAQDLRQRVLHERFPALRSGRVGSKREPAEFFGRLWKLRSLLPPHSPHGVAVDWLTVNPARFATPPDPPEDLAANAAEHVDAWYERSQGPDIFIYRATAGMPQEELVDWSFLTKLEDAPFAIRKHAAAILRPDATHEDAEIAALRNLLLGEAAEPVPTPDDPAPPPENRSASPLDPAWTALRANDPEAFLTALEALPDDGFDSVAKVVFDPLCPRIMSHAAAPRLLEILESRATAPGARPVVLASTPDVTSQSIRQLHCLFQDADPALAKRFRQTLLESRRFYLDPLLADLAKDPDRTEAVGLLAAVARGLGLPQPAAALVRFPPAPPDPFALTLGGRAAFLAAVRAGLCQELADRLAADAGEPVPPDLAALLRYAIRPTRETFRQEILSILDRQPDHLRTASRSNLVTILGSILDHVPLAVEHLLMHAESTASEGGFPGRFAAANRHPAEWDSPILESVWRRLRATGTDDAPPAALVSALAPVMLEVADDALWEEFQPALAAELARASSDGIPGSLHASLLTTRHRQRALDILRPLPVTRSGRDLRELARIAWLLDDEATLAAIGRRVDELPDQQDLQGLAAELDARAKPADNPVPVFTIIRQEDGKPVLCWTMTDAEPQLRVPVDPILAADGVFDLSIECVIGGESQPEPIQLEAIPPRGSHALPPMPGGTGNDLVIVKATRREDGEVVGTASVTVPHEQSVPLAPAIPATAPAPRPLAAPFDPMPPPTGLLLTGDTSGKLADIPWQPGQSLNIGLWAVLVGGVQLELRVADADQQTVASRRIYSRSTQNLPKWQSLDARFSPNELAGGRHLALYATGFPGVAAIWLAGLRVAATDETQNLPPMAVAVGRVPYQPTAMACSPDGAFLAFGAENGRVVVMDAATGATGEFAPRRALAITALAMSGKRVVAMDRRGTLQIMDLSTGAIRSPGALVADRDLDPHASIELSPDGEWLVWTDLRETVQIVKLEDDRLGRAVTLPVKDHPRFTIDRWSGTLIASGSAGHFIIPFADFATLDPVRLSPVPDFPAPRCAYRTFADDGQFRVRWEIPRHGLVVMADGGGFRAEPAVGTLRVPAAASGLAVAADGTVLFVAPGGMVHKLDCADLPSG